MTSDAATDFLHVRRGVERVAAAEDYCATNRLQLTPLRRRVLEILLERRRALGAYDILERLKQDGFGSQPPVAYRSLEFLVKHGFVHRIERLNAYVACVHPCQPHVPAFMICRICDSVTETTSAPVEQALGAAALEAGFTVEQTVIEAIGVCRACHGNGVRA